MQCLNVLGKSPHLKIPKTIKISYFYFTSKLNEKKKVPFKNCLKRGLQHIFAGGFEV